MKQLFSEDVQCCSATLPMKFDVPADGESGEFRGTADQFVLLARSGDTAGATGAFSDSLSIETKIVSGQGVADGAVRAARLIGRDRAATGKIHLSRHDFEVFCVDTSAMEARYSSRAGEIPPVTQVVKVHPVWDVQSGGSDIGDDMRARDSSASITQSDLSVAPSQRCNPGMATVGGMQIYLRNPTFAGDDGSTEFRVDRSTVEHGDASYEGGSSGPCPVSGGQGLRSFYGVTA